MIRNRPSLDHVRVRVRVRAYLDHVALPLCQREELLFFIEFTLKIQVLRLELPELGFPLVLILRSELG